MAQPVDIRAATASSPAAAPFPIFPPPRLPARRPASSAPRHDRYLSATLADPSLIRRYSNSDEIYIDLALGRLDLALGDAISLTERFLKTDLGRDFEFVGPELADPRWFGQGEGIAVRKGNAELVTRLNQALRQILADGTYAEIRTQYFDFDIYGSEVAMTHPPHAADGQEPNGR
jgi:hypothetical protein